MYRLLNLIFVALFLSFAAQADANGEFPPAASDGECFARVLTPLISDTIQEEVLVSPETYRIEITPAVYEEHSESFLVKEAATRFRLIPAVTDIIEEQVMVEPERIEKVVIPAEFETYTETVEVEPAREVWKPGTGLFGRTAALVQDVNAPAEMPTGEVLCRVLEPAKVETITRRRQISPPRVEEVVVPARYETIRREVVVEPPRYVEEAVPAVYETRVIRTLVTPAQERRVAVPAVYTTIEKEVVIGGGEIRWAEVLCASNTDRYKIAEIQGALTDAGYPTLIDGAFGPRTLRAMEAFQRSRGLAAGYMTVETAEALGIDPYGPPPPAVYALLGGSPPPIDESDQV